MCRIASLLALAVGLVAYLQGTSAFSQSLTPVKLVPSNAVDAYFGRSVAASDSWLLIAAPSDTNTTVNPAVTEAGAVYVMDAVKRVVTRRLFASPATTGQYFGMAVAVDGDVAAVGSPYYFTAGNGSVYLFNVKTGALLLQINAPVSADVGYFGASVALSPRWLVVGEPANAKVWVYDRSNLTLPPVELDKDFDYGGSNFGQTLAISGDSLLAGAPGYAQAMLYDLSALATSVKPSAVFSGDIGITSEFGAALAMHGQFIVIGSPTTSSPAFAGPGAVYVFDSTTRQRLLKLDPPQAIGNQAFGKSLALNGHLLLIGQGRTIVGNVHAWNLASGSYLETFTTTESTAEDYGAALALNRRGTALIGVPYDREISSGGSGAVFLLNPLLQTLPGDSIARIGGDLAAPAGSKLSKVASYQLNQDGTVLLQATITGAPRGQTGVLWNNRSGLLDVVQQTGVDPIGSATISAMKSPIMQLPLHTVFQATFTGPATQNAGLVMENGGAKAVLARKGTVPASAYFTSQPNAYLKMLGAMASSDDTSTPFVSVLSTVNAPGSRDSHLLVYDMNTGSMVGALNEGSATQGVGVTYTPLQMPTRVAATSNVALLPLPLVDTPATNAGLFKFAPESNFLFPIARKGQAIDATVGAPVFRSFLGETIQSYSGGQHVLFRASLTSGSSAQNEGLWAEDGSGALRLIARKGATTNQAPATGAPLLPATAKLSKVLRYWMLESGDAVVLAQFSGTGLKATNNTVLYRVAPDGTETLLLRAGDSARDCGIAKIGTLSRVEVDPKTGDYAVLTTLTGTDSASNQALWCGQASNFDPGARLLLRKGVLVDIGGSNTIASIAFLGTQSSTGAGGGGQASPLGDEQMAVQITLSNKSTILWRMRKRPELL